MKTSQHFFFFQQMGCVFGTPRLPGLQVMADDFTTSSTLRGLEWDAAQVRLKERWSAKVHVECEGVSALQAFLVVLCESSAE